MNLPDTIRDDAHPLGWPILGRFLSRTVCALGHDIVVMDHEAWDEPWLACGVCGARFLPASTIDEDTEVVMV